MVKFDKIFSIEMFPYGGVSSETKSLTGSCTLVKIKYTSGKEKNILVDIGRFQGYDEKYNEEDFLIKAESIDVVIITHNHADHVGLLPRLYAEGYKGYIYTHKNSIFDLKPIFEDDLKIMETNIKVATEKSKSLAKKLRKALSYKNGGVKTVYDLSQDYLDAITLLKEYKISSSKDIQTFKRREESKIKSSNFRRVEKSIQLAKLYDLINELYVANTKIKQDCNNDFQILEDYSINKSHQIKDIIPKIPELLYSNSDITGVLSKIKGFDYEVSINILPGVSIISYDAAHLPWSSQIVLNIHKESCVSKKIMKTPKRILFSGDLGKIRSFNLLGDLSFPKENIDCAVIESTYGDRNHKSTFEQDMDLFLDIYNKSLQNGGKIMIPAFSNHRIHQVLNMINIMIERQILPSNQKVYIVSALGQKLHRNRLKKNPYTQKRFLENKNFIWQSSDFTIANLKNKNKDIVPIVIASSGMIEGGSIMRQLKDFLPFKKNSIVTVGYMADGTYGRKIINGESNILVNNENIVVNCNVFSLGSFSGHAGQNDLLFYQQNLKLNKDAIIVYNHGDRNAVNTIMQKVKDDKVNTFCTHVKAEYNKAITIYKAV